MKPSYSKSSIEPVVAEKTSGSELTIRFAEPLESMHYASGISYEVSDGVMRVVIDRCPIRAECSTMVKRHVQPGASPQAEVTVPLQAGKVVMVYADGEAQIYP